MTQHDAKEFAMTSVRILMLKLSKVARATKREDLARAAARDAAHYGLAVLRGQGDLRRIDLIVAEEDRDDVEARGWRFSAAGFSLIETLVVVALMGTLLLLVGATTGRMRRRSQAISTVQELQAMLLAARIQAVRRGSNVVVAFDVPGHQVTVFPDKNQNYQRDPGEPILMQLELPPYVAFAAPAVGSLKDGVAFDQYPTAKGAENEIIFRPNGSIVPPLCPKCIAPRRAGGVAPDVPYGSIDCRGTNIPSTGLPPLHGDANGNNGLGCRGVYITRLLNGQLTDDTFRLSVDDFGQMGRVTLTKWIGPHNRNGVLFVPANPAWVWFDDSLEGWPK